VDAAVEIDSLGDERAVAGQGQPGDDADERLALADQRRCVSGFGRHAPDAHPRPDRDVGQVAGQLDRRRRAAGLLPVDARRSRAGVGVRLVGRRRVRVDSDRPQVITARRRDRAEQRQHGQLRETVRGAHPSPLPPSSRRSRRAYNASSRAGSARLSDAGVSHRYSQETGARPD
jgi:hypothetical protein